MSSACLIIGFIALLVGHIDFLWLYGERADLAYLGCAFIGVGMILSEGFGL